MVYVALQVLLCPRLNVQSFIEASNYIKKGVTILQILRNNEKRDFYWLVVINIRSTGNPHAK